MLGGAGRDRAGLVDGDLAGSGQPSLAFDHRHLVLLQQELDAGGELPRHLARAIDDLLQIEAHLLGRESVIAQMVQEMGDLGAAQQGLGRNAAPVQADAAQLVALDHRRLHAELGRPDRGDIAAGTRAQHDEIEGFLGHDVRSSRGPSG
jgi:hypothetical protein